MQSTETYGMQQKHSQEKFIAINIYIKKEKSKISNQYPKCHPKTLWGKKKNK